MAFAVTVDPLHALTALELIAGHAGGAFPIEVRNGHVETVWHEPGRSLPLHRRVAAWEDALSPDVRIGLPRRRGSEFVARSSVLWVVVEGSDQVKRARRFRPLPSMALAVGKSSRRWLLWALREPLGALDVKTANKRLAYAFHAVQRLGDPDVLWLPAPGSYVREGRSVPAPVTCERLTLAAYAPGQVVNRLKDPPEPTAWWERV